MKTEYMNLIYKVCQKYDRPIPETLTLILEQEDTQRINQIYQRKADFNDTYFLHSISKIANDYKRAEK